jgi:hypothetical protein
VIAILGSLDRDALEAMLVEQMPRELCAGPGVAIRRRAVTFQHPPYPKSWSESYDEDKQQYDDDGHGQIVSRRARVLLWSRLDQGVGESHK